MGLSALEKARIAERIADGEPAQRDSERLFDGWQKQNDKSAHEAKVREEIAIEKAIRNDL